MDERWKPRQRPTWEEMQRRLTSGPPFEPPMNIADAVREERDSR